MSDEIEIKYETFRNQMRDRREDRKLSQEKLAALVGKSTNYIESIENGRRNPGTELFIKLIIELGIDFNYCFGVKIDYKSRYEEDSETLKTIKEMLDKKYKE
jgi:transcriptional regulator with XRE-family HTH domain